MGDGIRECYILKHWRLHYASDGIVATGHLYGREGYESGISVRTSSVCGWEEQNGQIILRTMNSIYRCSLHEYIAGSSSIRLLGEITARKAHSALARVFDKIGDVQKEREAHYAALFSRIGDHRCLLLCWCGCMTPYLKRIVTYDRGKIETEDIQGESPEVMLRADLYSTDTLVIRPYRERPAEAYSPGGLRGAYSIVIENDGGCEFRASVSGRQVIVGAGAAVLVQRGGSYGENSGHILSTTWKM